MDLDKTALREAVSIWVHTVHKKFKSQADDKADNCCDRQFKG